MPVIPILLSDSAALVEYKVRLAREVGQVEDDLARLRRRRAYFDGQHALLLNDDQKAFLKGILGDDEDDWPIDNKCKTVVEKVKARLNVTGFRDAAGAVVRIEQAEGEQDTAGGADRRRPTADRPGAMNDQRPMSSAPAGDAVGVRGRNAPAAVDLVSQWWNDNEMDRWEGELYKTALRDRQGYVVVDYDAAQGRPRYTLAEMWDGDSGMRMIYEDPQTRQKPIAALKYWWTLDPVQIEASNVLRCTVYTANAVYKYARFYNERQLGQYEARIAGARTEDGFWPIVDEGDAGWPLAWTDGQGQPLGLAVVPFTSPRGSLIDPIVGLNNALNKTNLDLLANADQQGFGIPVIEYEQGLPMTKGGDDPTADADGLGMRPGRALEVGKAKVHKLPAEDMAGLLDTAAHWVRAIAANANIPVYEFTPTVGEVPSGAALQMLDSTLAEVADECVTWWTAAWRQVFGLALKLEAVYGRGPADVGRITPLWKPTARQSVDADFAKLELERRKLNLQRDQQGLTADEALLRAGGNAGIAARLQAAAAGDQGPQQGPGARG